MNPFYVLSADHVRLFELTGGAGDPAGSQRARRRLARQLVMEASSHEAIEEQLFWPIVRERLKGGRELALAGVEQEVGSRKLLHDLDRTGSDDDTFTTMVFTAASRIRNHVTYEEGQLWPKLQLALDAHELDRLGTELAKAKRTAPTRPHPRVRPDSQLLRALVPWAGRLDRVLDVLTLRGR